MDSTEPKNYSHMENVLNQINKDYITLPVDEVQRNNVILKQVLDLLIEKMKEVSPLFCHLFERTFYGGSYYDGIKINKPEEYDLDFILTLPLLIEPEVQVSDRHGFVHVRINEFAKLMKHKKELGKFEKIDEMLIENSTYLSTTKVLVWMEKIYNLALNKLERTSDGYCFPVKINEQEIVVHGILSKAHPAFTMKLRNKEAGIHLDVDLVPCFQFTDEKWPKGDYRKNPTKKNKFLVVPKKPHSTDTEQPIEKYWRLSFQEQERELMKGNNFKVMKPSLKLLKKLRDKYVHTKIASYFIKTVFLWEIEVREEKFWSQPLSNVFMVMLQRYMERIRDQEIPYYWNKKFNMIGHIQNVTLIAIRNTLQNIITDINNKLDDPFVIGRCLIQSDELEKLRGTVVVSKKRTKKQNNAGLDLSIDSVDECSVTSSNNGKYSSSSSSDVLDGSSSCDKHSSIDIFERATTTAFWLPINSDISAEAKILNILTSLNTKVDGIAENLSQLTRTCSRMAARLDAIEEKLSSNSTGRNAANDLSFLGDRLIDTVNFSNLRLQ